MSLKCSRTCSNHFYVRLLCVLRNVSRLRQVHDFSYIKESNTFAPFPFSHPKPISRGTWHVIYIHICQMKEETRDNLCFVDFHVKGRSRSRNNKCEERIPRLAACRIYLIQHRSIYRLIYREAKLVFVSLRDCRTSREHINAN